MGVRRNEGGGESSPESWPTRRGTTDLLVLSNRSLTAHLAAHSCVRARALGRRHSSSYADARAAQRTRYTAIRKPSSSTLHHQPRPRRWRATSIIDSQQSYIAYSHHRAPLAFPPCCCCAIARVRSSRRFAFAAGGGPERRALPPDFPHALHHSRAVCDVQHGAPPFAREGGVLPLPDGEDGRMWQHYVCAEASGGQPSVRGEQVEAGWREGRGLDGESGTADRRGLRRLRGGRASTLR